VARESCRGEAHPRQLLEARRLKGSKARGRPESKSRVWPAVGHPDAPTAESAATHHDDEDHRSRRRVPEGHSKDADEETTGNVGQSAVAPLARFPMPCSEPVKDLGFRKLGLDHK
jgi:hypothetical protein